MLIMMMMMMMTLRLMLIDVGLSTYYMYRNCKFMFVTLCACLGDEKEYILFVCCLSIYLFVLFVALAPIG